MTKLEMITRLISAKRLSQSQAIKDNLSAVIKELKENDDNDKPPAFLIISSIIGLFLLFLNTDVVKNFFIN